MGLAQSLSGLSDICYTEPRRYPDFHQLGMDSNFDAMSSGSGLIIYREPDCNGGESPLHRSYCFVPPYHRGIGSFMTQSFAKVHNHRQVPIDHMKEWTDGAFRYNIHSVKNLRPYCCKNKTVVWSRTDFRDG